MPEFFTKHFLWLLLLISSNIFAQDDKNWAFTSPYAGKYYESPYNTRGYFEQSESGRFNIKSLADAQLIIKKNLQTNVIAVQLANIPSNELQNVFISLGQFPKLTYIKLLGGGGLNQDQKVNAFVANISKLPKVRCIEFAHIDAIDMDAALNKLIAIKQLRALSFTEYNYQLPSSITLLNQIDSLKLSTVNIGNNDLSKVNWRKLSVTGNPKSWSDSTGNITRQESEILLKLSQIKTLKSLGLDVDLRYPDFISKFTQIEELSIGAGIEGRPSLPFTQAVGSLNQLQKLSIESTGDKLVMDVTPLANLTQLKSLYLKLNELPIEGVNALRNLKNLESLELIQAKIGMMPDIFSEMKRLKRAILIDDELTKIPISLFNCPLLETLVLPRNRLTVLPDIFYYGCKNLKHLNISENKIMVLPQAFGGLPELETINCADNHIQTIPGGWAFLQHLKEVNFARNELTQFPDGLQNNHTVERITLFFNRIETFPDIEPGDYKLKYLGITGNQNLFELPEHIGYYTELDSLEAQQLRLKTIPESLGDCRKLKMLLLSRSIAAKIALPTGLQNTKELETLYLDNNPLLDKQSVFDWIFSHPRPALRINLSANDIKTLPATNKWLTTPFTSLYLNNNPISGLPQQLINSKVKGNIETQRTGINPNP